MLSICLNCDFRIVDFERYKYFKPASMLSQSRIDVLICICNNAIADQMDQRGGEQPYHDKVSLIYSI